MGDERKIVEVFFNKEEETNKQEEKKLDESRNENIEMEDGITNKGYDDAISTTTEDVVRTYQNMGDERKIVEVFFNKEEETSKQEEKKLDESRNENIEMENGITNKGYEDTIRTSTDDGFFSLTRNNNSQKATHQNGTTSSGVFSFESPSLQTKNPNEKQEDSVFVVRKPKTVQISYEYLVWFLFAVITILCIIDRFVMKGDVVLKRKGKLVFKLWGKNFGQTVTNIIWGITARMIITSQNLMFYTMLWCIPNIISEMAPNFMNIIGIRDIHTKIHRLAGIFLIGIPSLAHVLVIFLPPIVDRTQLTYSPPSRFNYSQQYGNLNWTKIWDPAAVENWVFNDSKGVHLTSDEIYRFVLMIVLFCLIFPLTRSRFLNERSYSLAIGIHAFAGVWYAIDNIRKITHGLAHVFNVPFLLIWCLDRFLSIVYYRKSHGAIKTKIVGNNEYIDIRVKLNNKFNPGIGDVYYLLNERYSSFNFSPERAHPFTSFSNHDVTDASWDIGFIISIMDDNTQWFPSWTRRIVAKDYEAQSRNVKCWGPYRSSVWQIYKELEKDEQNFFVLFASGSGFGYLYDVISILAHCDDSKNGKGKCPTIDIHYTVRCVDVYNKFASEIQEKIKLIKEKKTANVSFNWYLTDKAEESHQDVQFYDEIKLHEGCRIEFEKIIRNSQKESKIYFVGRPSLADHIGKLCQKYNQKLIKDFVNSQRGSSDKSIMATYLKFTLYVVVATILLGILLHIYLR